MRLKGFDYDQRIALARSLIAMLTPAHKAVDGICRAYDGGEKSRNPGQKGISPKTAARYLILARKQLRADNEAREIREDREALVEQLNRLLREAMAQKTAVKVKRTKPVTVSVRVRMKSDPDKTIEVDEVRMESYETVELIETPDVFEAVQVCRLAVELLGLAVPATLKVKGTVKHTVDLSGMSDEQVIERAGALGLRVPDHRSLRNLLGIGGPTASNAEPDRN